MRTFVKMAAAFGLAFCLSATANAQGQRGGMGMMGGGLNILRDKAVQKELKMSDEQVEKADKAATEMGEKMREKFQDLQGLDAAERTEKMQAIQKEMGAETKKIVGELLKAEQTKRYDQLVMQQMGYRAFANPDVQSKLKFTDEQKNKVKDGMDDAMAKMQELFPRQGGGGGGAPDPEMQKKRAAFQKETMEKMTGLLTEDQKKSWKDMTGEPFTFSPPQIRRPGGGN